MWPFDYFKRKREEKKRLAIEAENKRLQELKKKYLERKCYIDTIVETHRKSEYSKQRTEINEHNNRAKINNAKCPKCNNKDVIQVYRRHKGDIEGSIKSTFDSYHSSFLFASYSHNSYKQDGYIDGHLDTLVVNKCNSCNHEWEHIEDKSILNSKEYYRGKINWTEYTGYLLSSIYRAAEKIKNFNPNDLDEVSSTLKEKIEVCLNEIKNEWFFDYLKDTSIEVLYYYARTNYDLGNYLTEFCFYDNYLKDKHNAYMGKFVPYVENFLYQLGFRNYFN